MAQAECLLRLVFGETTGQFADMTDSARRQFREKIVSKLTTVKVEGSESAAADKIAEDAAANETTEELTALVSKLIPDLTSSTEMVEWLKQTRTKIKSEQKVTVSPSAIPRDVLQRLVSLDQGAKHHERSIPDVCDFLSACVDLFKRNMETSAPDAEGGVKETYRTRDDFEDDTSYVGFCPLPPLPSTPAPSTAPTPTPSTAATPAPSTAPTPAPRFRYPHLAATLAKLRQVRPRDPEAPQGHGRQSAREPRHARRNHQGAEGDQGEVPSASRLRHPASSRLVGICQHKRRVWFRDGRHRWKW